MALRRIDPYESLTPGEVQWVEQIAEMAEPRPGREQWLAQPLVVYVEEPDANGVEQRTVAPYSPEIPIGASLGAVGWTGTHAEANTGEPGSLSCGGKPGRCLIGRLVVRAHQGRMSGGSRPAPVDLLKQTVESLAASRVVQGFASAAGRIRPADPPERGECSRPAFEHSAPSYTLVEPNATVIGVSVGSHAPGEWLNE